MTVYEKLLVVTLFAFVLIGCAEPETIPTAAAPPTQAVTLPSPTPTTAPTATPELAPPTPQLPVQISAAGVNDDLGSPHDVTVAGDYAYIADSSAGLHVVDISDPANPQAVGAFDPTGSTSGQGVYYAEPYLFLSDGLGLLILDVSDPTAPEETGFHHPPGFTVQSQVIGQYAYAANREGGLSIADVSDPTEPQSLSVYFDVGADHVFDVAVSGDYAYAALEDQGLKVVDVSDPVSPVEVGAFDTGGTAVSLTVADPYVYLADGEAGLRIFDVTDPAQPQEVGFYDAPDGFAQDIFLAEPYAFLADDSSILVIDVTDLTNPTLAGAYETPGVVWAIHVSDSYAYVANGPHGLLILRLDFE